jgi:hypothetical protein
MKVAIVVLGVSLAAVSLVVLLLAAIMVPALSAAREDAQRFKAARLLVEEIETAVSEFERDNGRAPSSWGELSQGFGDAFSGLAGADPEDLLKSRGLEGCRLKVRGISGEQETVVMLDSEFAVRGNQPRPPPQQ